MGTMIGLIKYSYSYSYSNYTQTTIIIRKQTNKQAVSQYSLEPTIYRTRGEHANHYATDAIEKGIIKI
jgi:hypothetical protein